MHNVNHDPVVLEMENFSKIFSNVHKIFKGFFRFFQLFLQILLKILKIMKF